MSLIPYSEVSGSVCLEDYADKRFGPDNKTIFRLPTSGGTEVYVIGTAHVSSISADEARLAILALRPQVVMLELCSARSAIVTVPPAELMKSSPKTLTEAIAVYRELTQQEQNRINESNRREEELAAAQALEASTLAASTASSSSSSSSSPSSSATSATSATTDATETKPTTESEPARSSLGTMASSLAARLQRGNGGPPSSPKVGKQVSTQPILLRVLLGYMSFKIGSDLKVVPGSEFRTAYEAAGAVNAQVVFGDRQMEITLRRIWRGLRFPERLLFIAWIGCTTLFTISSDDIESLKDADLFSALSLKFRRYFPMIYQVLFCERDLYLAYSLVYSARHALQVSSSASSSTSSARLKSTTTTTTTTSASSTPNASTGTGIDAKNATANTDSNGESTTPVAEESIPVIAGRDNSGSVPCVVAVVGLGHVPGIIAYWNRFTMAVPPSTTTTTATTTTTTTTTTAATTGTGIVPPTRRVLPTVKQLVGLDPEPLMPESAQLSIVVKLFFGGILVAVFAILYALLG